MSRQADFIADACLAQLSINLDRKLHQLSLF